jgi:hypothetical protein
MNNFIDLEPILGTSDHIWENFVKELNTYPYRHESAYIGIEGHSSSTRYLLRSQIKHLRNSESTAMGHYDVNNVGLEKSWTDEWNTYPSDTRITLVEQIEKNNKFYKGNLIDKNIDHFTHTWEYLNSLPIHEFYRVIIIKGYPKNPLPIHKDWNNVDDPCETKKLHMFFVNPRNNRPFFYVEDGRKVFTNSSIFILNNAALPHGILSEDHHTALIRVYCAFTDEFCDKLGIYKVEK